MSDHDPYRWGRGKLPDQYEPAPGASQQVENSGGTVIDPASEQTLTSATNLLDALEDALASVDQDHLKVQEDTAMNVSAATVPTEPVQGSSIESVASQMASLTRGEMRLASTGQITVSDNLNILLENPGGSGVDVTLFGVTAANNAGQVTFPTLHTNPTTDLPTTARTITDPNLETGAASAAVIYADDMANEMSGGDDEMTFAVEGGRTEMQTFFKLSPGDSVGLSNPFSGLTSADATFTGWFIEETR